jgi:hypothetical protein
LWKHRNWIDLKCNSFEKLLFYFSRFYYFITSSTFFCLFFFGFSLPTWGS